MAESAQWPIADRGTGTLDEIDTAAPCEAPRPGGAWASLAEAPVLVFDCTPPVAVLGRRAAAAAAWAKAEPVAGGGRVGMYTHCRAVGSCANCCATSITTEYWFWAL